jgi:putative intracellular protease/amidase
MAGKRSAEQGDLVTPRAIYRRDIDAVDGSVESSSIPELDTRGGPNISVGLGQGDINMYGRNAQLDLAVILFNFPTATLELWLKAAIEQAQLSTDTPEPDLLLPETEDWVFVESKDFTRSALWTVKDVPPGRYKVVVASLGPGSSSSSDSSSSGGGPALHILEGHAA